MFNVCFALYKKTQYTHNFQTNFKVHLFYEVAILLSNIDCRSV